MSRRFALLRHGMRSAPGPAVLLPVVALVIAVEPHVEACIADDAAACRALGREALQIGDAERRAEALLHFVHACDLGDGTSCDEAATLIEAREPVTADVLRERARRLGEVPATTTPEAPPPEPPTPPAVVATDDWAEPETSTGGSRFGGIAYVAGKVGATRPGIVAGVGLRFGLRERAPDPFMFMPALALVGGIAWDSSGPQPWGEVRLELMGARGGGALQPAFHGSVSAGFTVRPGTVRGVVEPLGGLAGPSVTRPYAGIGTGWNWLPRNGRSLDAGIVSLMVGLPLIFAGRVELRVAPPLNEADSTEVSALFGTGF